MFDVILSPNDCDAELYRKIREAASEQNISPHNLQRNILYGVFNISRHHSYRAKQLLLHQALTKRSITDNIPSTHVMRNCLREYFGLPLIEKNVLSSPKKRTPLKQGENRFRILSFLVTVDAATKSELDEKLEMDTRDTLRANLHYFQRIRIPYDVHFWWRVTERGRQDYSAIVGQQISTVDESNLESARIKLENLREGAIQERIAHEEQKTRKRKMRESKVKVRKQKIIKEPKIEQEQIEKTEKIRVKERKPGRQPVAQIKILKFLATVGNYVTHTEIRTLTGVSRPHTSRVLRNLSSSGYIEKVSCRICYYCITESGRQELSGLEQMCDSIQIDEAYLQKIADRDISANCTPIVENEEQEAKVEESFKIGRELRAGKRGIERYFSYDLNNPIDQEIIGRIGSASISKYHERKCRIILCRRLSLSAGADYANIDQLIEQRLLKRCKQRGITRTELVRELFCIQLNIKGYEVLHAIRV